MTPSTLCLMVSPVLLPNRNGSKSLGLFVNPVTGDSTVGFDPNSRIGWNGPYHRVFDVEFITQFAVG